MIHVAVYENKVRLFTITENKSDGKKGMYNLIKFHLGHKSCLRRRRERSEKRRIIIFIMKPETILIVQNW
jgi:hypothetical protein